MGPHRLADTLVAAAFAVTPPGPRRIAPAPAPDDTLITCTGGLVMEPVRSPADRLESPRDARVELRGAPVELEDPASSSAATCAALRYDVGRAEVELLGSDAHPLLITSPELVARGSRFWLREGEGVGGFSGAGDASLREVPTDATTETPRPPGAAPHEKLRIRWTERADLGFERSDGADQLGGLRSAEFVGTVAVRTTGVPLMGATPDAPDTDGRSELDCDGLLITFAPAPDASDTKGVVARYLHATGDVQVRDDRQSLAAQSLEVWMADAASVHADAEERADVDRVAADTEVHLVLPDGQEIFADRLDVDAVERTAVLTGTDVRIVDGNHLIDRMEVVTVDEARNHYVIAGKGRFRRFEEPPAPGASADDPAGRSEELRVTWRDGLELYPEGPDAEAAGTPDVAWFTGDVMVVSPELKLTHADEMLVRFTSDDGGPDGGGSIESIEARGSVHARSAGDPGAIRADLLHIDLATNADGATVPTQMIATGSVHLTDELQAMWTESLTVTFRETGSGPAAPEGDEFAGARVAIDRAHADGGVQLRLEGGERVFADRLDADGARETADVRGERVVVVGTDFVLDHAAHIVVDRRAGRYEVRGPGTFDQYAAPVLDSTAVDRINRPEIDGEKTLAATWTTSAAFDESAGDAGTLTLRGTVRAVSRPGPLERDSVEAEVLALEFVEPSAPSDVGARRELSRLVAEGAPARLESRTWRDISQSERPRVFSVAGRHIQFDQRTLDAIVTGDGELLIRDEWDDGTENTAAPGGFAARGTTLFRWSDILTLTQTVTDRFEIVMKGDVTCLHQALDGRQSALTGQQLQALVERDEAAAPREHDQGLQFGGAMKARRISGRGGLAVRTPERDVACDEFDYNLVTGLAELRAAPGRMVSILSDGAAEPVRHERVIWDMNRDTITVYRGGAAGPP